MIPPKVGAAAGRARQEGPWRGREHALEAALAGIAQASDAAGQAGDRDRLMREIAESPQVLSWGKRGQAAEAARSLHGEYGGLAAKIRDGSRIGGAEKRDLVRPP